jgi:EamA-like transporter family.
MTVTALILIASIVFFSMQAIALKKIKVTTLRENILETSLFSGAVAVCFWIYGIFSKIEISPATFWYGVLFGAVFVLTITCYYYALHTGPMSYTIFFYSASMLIPSLAGILIWRDSFRWTLGVSIVLYLLAFYFICVPGAKKGKRWSKKWLLLCLVTWFLNGSLSVIVKAQQMTMKGTQASSMTTVAFTWACLLSFAVYFILTPARRETGKTGKDFRYMGTLLLPLLAIALGNGGGNFTITYLSSRISSAYLFPCVLGSMMIVVTLYSIFLLKEKVNRFGIIGIIIGIAALLLINV